MSINSGTASGKVVSYLKAGQTVYYANVTVYIKKVSGTTVKKFTKKVYPSLGKITWKGTHSLAAKGMSVTPAVAYIKNSGKHNVYSFTATMAKAVIRKAGYTVTAASLTEGEIHNKNKTEGWYYYHFHPKVSGTRAHSFYGVAHLAQNYGINIR